MSSEREPTPKSSEDAIELTHNRPISLETAMNDEKRRQEFAIRLIELADDFDDIDHRFASNGMMTGLQNDCHAARELARSFPKPATQELSGSRNVTESFHPDPEFNLL